MKRFGNVNVPVLAFTIVLFVGWGLFLALGDWWWLPGAILAAIMAGDLTQAVMEKYAPKKPKGKGIKKK